MTRDHIPPKALFSPTSKSNLMTVLCCYDCNNQYAKMDQEFAVLVLLSKHRKKGGDKLFEKHTPILRTKLESLRQEIVNDAEHIMKINQNGIEEMHSSKWPDRFMYEYFPRLVKGLMARDHQDFSQLKFDDFATGDSFTEFVKYPFFENFIDRHKMKAVRTFRDEDGNHVFSYYKYFRQNDGMYIFRFYDGVFFSISFERVIE